MTYWKVASLAGVFVADVFRIDIPRIRVSDDEARLVSEFRSKVKRDVRDGAKPDTCLICGEPLGAPCSSHTVPRYCLKEIAVDGKLYTWNVLVGTNLLSSEVGVGEAATFRMICRRCDTDYFKLYETPETLLSTPTMQVMGQIAAKTLLREIGNARLLQGSRDVLGAAVDPYTRDIVDMREVDRAEDEAAFRTAVKVGRGCSGGDAYSVVYYNVLPYTAPFAFQQMVSPLSDFNGGLINNSYNYSKNYRMEPLFVCVLPSKGNTFVLMFRRSNAKRYRQFEKQFRARTEDEKLEAVVKLIFAYSDDMLLSKGIRSDVIENDSLRSLAVMNHNYLSIPSEPECSIEGEGKKNARMDFALDNLPRVPNLLLSEYAIRKNE